MLCVLVACYISEETTSSVFSQTVRLLAVSYQTMCCYIQRTDSTISAMAECVGHFCIEGSEQTIYTFFYSSESVLLL